MIVKSKDIFKSKEGFWKAGTTQEVSDVRGKELIRRGLVEEVKPKAENRTTKEDKEDKKSKK